MVFDMIIFIIFAEWDKLWTLGNLKLLVFAPETVEINNTIITHTVKIWVTYNDYKKLCNLKMWIAVDWNVHFRQETKFDLKTVCSSGADIYSWLLLRY
jgi:hypothetical protein